MKILQISFRFQTQEITSDSSSSNNSSNNFQTQAIVYPLSQTLFYPFFIFFRPVSLRTASSPPSERGDRADSSVDDNSQGSMLRNNWAMTKTAQYRKLKSDWKNIVLLSKSRIQGLGLFATRDIEPVSELFHLVLPPCLNTCFIPCISIIALFKEVWIGATLCICWIKLKMQPPGKLSLYSISLVVLVNLSGVSNC